MEYLAGQPTRFVHCSCYTVLCDEVSKLANENLRAVIISCLAPILQSLEAAQDVESAIEKAMVKLGSVLKDLARIYPSIWILVAQSTPRATKEFAGYAKAALVVTIELSKRENLLSYHFHVLFYSTSCLSQWRTLRPSPFSIGMQSMMWNLTTQDCWRLPQRSIWRTCWLSRKGPWIGSAHSPQRHQLPAQVQALRSLEPLQRLFVRFKSVEKTKNIINLIKLSDCKFI